MTYLETKTVGGSSRRIYSTKSENEAAEFAWFFSGYYFEYLPNLYHIQI